MSNLQHLWNSISNLPKMEDSVIHVTFSNSDWINAWSENMKELKDDYVGNNTELVIAVDNSQKESVIIKIEYK